MEYKMTAQWSRRVLIYLESFRARAEQEMITLLGTHIM